MRRDSTRTYNKNLRFEVEALRVDSMKQFFFKGLDLVKNVNDLTASIRQTKNIGLSKVAVNREDDHVENSRNPREESINVARIRSLKDLRKNSHCFFYSPCVFSPSFLETPLLKPEFWFNLK